MKNTRFNPISKAVSQQSTSWRALGLAMLPFFACLLFFAASPTKVIAQELTLDFSEEDAALPEEQRLKLIKKNRRRARSLRDIKPTDAKIALYRARNLELIPFKKELAKANSLKELKPLEITLTKNCIEYQYMLSEGRVDVWNNYKKVPEKINGKSYLLGQKITVLSTEYESSSGDSVRYKFFLSDELTGDPTSICVYHSFLDDTGLEDSLWIWSQKSSSLRDVAWTAYLDQRILELEQESKDRVEYLQQHEKPVISDFYSGMLKRDEAYLNGKIPVEFAGIQFQKHEGYSFTNYGYRDPQERLTAVSYYSAQEWSMNAYYEEMRATYIKLAAAFIEVYGQPTFQKNSYPDLVTLTKSTMLKWESHTCTRVLQVIHDEYDDNRPDRYVFHFYVLLKYPEN